MSTPYSELVRGYFANPVHAGHLPDEYNDGVMAEAAEPDGGARVVLSALVDGETIRRLRYKILGCPHLIAATEAFCDDTEGQEISALIELDVRKLMERLAIPVEKTGRLFILEDAAKALHISVSALRPKED
jgi:NifU-like protein involved in Fe-S cluster formation